MMHELEDILRNTLLISGLVITMMMMLECLNIGSHGKIMAGLKNRKGLQVVVSALLGAIPGCMGGFASVSLYTHGLMGFGALVAMMIASSGDEAFVMLSMIPREALGIFAAIFVIAVLSGWATDFLAARIRKKRNIPEPLPDADCGVHYDIHPADEQLGGHEGHGRHFGLKRLLLFLGVALFITALGFGFLEHGHEGHEHGSLELLDEEWMNMLFAVLSIAVLGVIVCASDHFVEEHLWHHVVVKHLGSIVGWTFGVLVAMELLLSVFDVSAWISGNTALMILFAALVGLIPESGPHLIFVTLFATGVIPMPVLLASCISQDGHASIPLLAESKAAFIKAKLINVAVALVAGYFSLILL